MTGLGSCQSTGGNHAWFNDDRLAQPGGRGAGTSKCRFLHASGRILTFVGMIDMIDKGLLWNSLSWCDISACFVPRMTRPDSKKGQQTTALHTVVLRTSRRG